MAPYWASLPLAQSSNPLRGVHLLQDELLASTMIMHDAYTRNIFDGGKPQLVQRSAEELSHLSVEKFLQLVRVVKPSTPWSRACSDGHPHISQCAACADSSRAHVKCFVRALMQALAVGPRDDCGEARRVVLSPTGSARPWGPGGD